MRDDSRSAFAMDVIVSFAYFLAFLAFTFVVAFLVIFFVHLCFLFVGLGDDEQTDDVALRADINEERRIENERSERGPSFVVEQPCGALCVGTCDAKPASFEKNVT
jgi:hypothetical protein